MKTLEIKNLGVDRAEVLLYGDIGGWGHTAATVREQLDRVTVSEITLRIHSYGGDALEGIAIKNVLRAHPARIVAVVDGTAASAASLIAVAGSDELVMGENSELMIHDGWMFADGDANDLRKLADRLDKVSENYASAYAAKAGGDPADWRALMMAETWFSAEEAVQIGLADRVAASVDTAEITAAGQSRVFARFKYSGRRASPAPSFMAPLGQEGKSMDFMASVAQRLGVSADADENTVLAALDETLTEQANETGTITIPVKPDLSAFTKDEIVKMLASLNVDVENTDTDVDESVQDADGDEPADDESDVDTGDAEVSTESTDDDNDLTVVVDKERLAQLEADAEYGRQAREKAKFDEAKAFAEAAFKANKIGAAARERWAEAFLVDREDAETRMAAIAPGMVHRTETGYAAGATESANAEAEAAKISAAFGL